MCSRFRYIGCIVVLNMSEGGRRGASVIPARAPETTACVRVLVAGTVQSDVLEVTTYKPVTLMTESAPTMRSPYVAREPDDLDLRASYCLRPGAAPAHGTISKCTGRLRTGSHFRRDLCVPC